jgi:hypothetical protein
MANNNKTILQRLGTVIQGVNAGSTSNVNKIVNYNLSPSTSNNVLYSFNTAEERDTKLRQLKQEKLLAHQWKKIARDSMMTTAVGLNQVKVMYRDADLMDQFPEINSGLHVLAEESTTIDIHGKMLHVYSTSARIKSILEDLFENRLNINVELPMVTRATCKYGNEFMFLNIDPKEGILGWRELNVHQINRVECGAVTAYGGANVNAPLSTNPNDVKFVWEGHNEATPYQSWQVAHFRLIKDSLYLPYGVSWLNGARRHWRMLSMMEDAMMLYRLERSIERRIFKVNVGLIDDADVPAFLQEFMNTVKRAPIIDPSTGQIDLRKNFLDVSADYVIPVRPGQDPTSIDTLQAAQNQTSMEDIQYIENKILSILRVPKSFLNFQEAQGKGQNLSLVDIRFNRTVNAVQQAILMELNKIAIIHLYLLGFSDEITNFTLTLNNPSNQIEAVELENLTKRITAASSALAEQGGGIPLMSWHQVQKEIMGKTDEEISTILNEIRIEAALANELQMTTQIIEKTGLFDKADRLYGKPGAKYQPMQQGEEGGMGGLGGGGGAPMGGMDMGGDFGGDLDGLGEPGSEDMGDIGGEEGSTDLESMPLNEQINKIVNDFSKSQYFKLYNKLLTKESRKYPERPKIVNDNIIINESLTSTLDELSKKINEKTELDKLLDE